MNNETVNKQPEITLKRFIHELWQDKILISVITVVVFLAAVLFTYFTSEIRYKSKALVGIDAVIQLDSQFGSYMIPLTAVDEYANFVRDPQTAALTIESMDLDISPKQLLDSVTINVTRGVNYFWVTVESDTAENAKAIAENHLKSFSHTINILLRNMAVNSYINQVRAQNSLLTNTLEITLMEIAAVEGLLNEIPEYISAPGVPAGTDGILDPEYIKYSEKLAELRILQNSTQVAIVKSTSSLQSLINEKELLAKSRNDLEYESSVPGVFDRFSSVVNIINTPDLGEGTSTGKMLFSALTGIIFGSMLGIFAARVKRQFR